MNIWLCISCVMFPCGLLLMLLVVGAASQGPLWFTATRAPNGTQYVVGGSIPYYMTDSIPKPLFIIDGTGGSSGALVAVVGANGAKSLSFPESGESLIAATDTCVISVTEGGLNVQALIGGCSESGRRNGPLMFARFMSIAAISAVLNRGALFIAILDLERAGNNVLLANSWSVRDIGQVGGGAFDLSLLVTRESNTAWEEVAVLVLTSLSASLILGNDNAGGSNNVFSADGWSQWVIGDSELLKYNNTVPGRFTACLLQNFKNNTEVCGSSSCYMAYLVDENMLIWRIVTATDNGRGNRGVSVYRSSLLGYSNHITRLFLGSDGTSLSAVDNVAARFVDVQDLEKNNSGQITAIASTNSSCNNPWMIDHLCPVGYIMSVWGLCIVCPPGGYADGSRWVPCPVGTYNSLPMAVSIGACKRCGPSSVAPSVGSVVCSSCNDSHPWQSFSGSECLATCFALHNVSNTGEFICKSCLPGFFQQSSCQVCPENFSSLGGSECLSCAENQISISGSKYCSAVCPPSTCSPDGLKSCSSWSPPHLVSTLAIFQNIDGMLLSIAVCSNGTIYVGNDRGTLIIAHRGENREFTNSMPLVHLGIRNINTMTLSGDERYLFVGDHQENLILMVYSNGNEIEILTSRSKNISPLSLCWAPDQLYVVSGLNDNNNSLVSISFTKPFSVKHVYTPYQANILHVTPHESGQGVTCLLNASTTAEGDYFISIWHLYLADSGFSLKLLASLHFSYPLKVNWISRWKLGMSTLCVGNAVVAVLDIKSDNICLGMGELEYHKYITATNESCQPNVTLIAGAESMGHRDGEAGAARIIAPVAAVATANSLFILEDQTSSVRSVYARQCECAENYYMLNRLGKKACVPCPQHTYSMVGSRGCSTCLSGKYMDANGRCVSCPQSLFWLTQSESMMSPCREMQGSVGDTQMMIGLNLLEAQNLADMGNKYNYILMSGLDIVSNATILLTGVGEYTIPPPDIWVKGDMLGRLWSIRKRMTPKPFDPRGVAIQSSPGIWALCSPIVLPDQTCTCYHSALQLGYYLADNHIDIENKWRDSRVEAALQNISSNISFTSVFVLRPDDLHTTAPILIREGGGSVKLTSSFPAGDMGMCVMGWPAQFNCTDPNYFWVLPSELYPGGACLPCPPGSIALTHSSMECLSIGQHNPLCKAGTFKTFSLETTGHVCKICPPDSYSNAQGAVQCLVKTVLLCPQGFYIADGGLTSDNTCVQCSQCGDGAVMIPFDFNPCPGNTKNQPYMCVAWLKNIPGFFALVSLGTLRVGAPVSPMLRYSPCANLPLYAAWDNGPRHDLCYFRCKYGVNWQWVREYAFYWGLLSAGLENSWSEDANLFPSSSSLLSPSSSAIKAMSSVCATCNTSDCPVGMWRPLWADGCGPPCHISPSLCQGRVDGCVLICNISDNAVVDSFYSDATGRPLCQWRCNIGWIKVKSSSTDEFFCQRCSASLCQVGEFYVGDSRCSPDMSLSQVCIPCQPTVKGGILSLSPLSEIGKCSYVCLENFFYPNPNPQSQVVCVQCAEVVTRCPAGFSVTCALNPCKACQNPNTLAGKAVLVPTNDSVCRVQCRPGFHTINIWDDTILSSSQAYDPSLISCIECSRRPSIPCPSLSCGAGYQAFSDAAGCVRCKSSLEMMCSEGTYAPPCLGGGRVTQTVVGCLTCAMHSLLVSIAIESGDIVPEEWPTRMFIPYSYNNVNQSVLPMDSVNCPTACVHGSVQVRKSATVVSCQACSALFPTLPPKNAPYSFYFSMWNASDGLRWWPREFDPSHLPERRVDSVGNLLIEKRAGLCWPCSLTVNYLNGDPCWAKSKHINSGYDENNMNQPISSDSTVGEIGQPPSFVWVFNAVKSSRRLFAADTQSLLLPLPLSSFSSQCDKGKYPAPPLRTWCSVCPEGHYCIGGNVQPIGCGPFASSATGSQSAKNCFCRPGFVFDGHFSCVLSTTFFSFPCPPGHHKVIDLFGGGGNSNCIPCPPGTWEKNDRCHDCPLHSFSREGSTGCTCGGDADAIVVPTVVATTEACPSDGCPQGSSLDSADSKCKQCSASLALSIPNNFPFTCSRGPGSYMSSMQLCLPCPRGTFSKYAGSAPCTLCPEGSTTLFAGSNNMASCSVLFFFNITKLDNVKNGSLS